MARWTLAGSLGVVAGPLALSAAAWRELFLLLIASRFRFANGQRESEKADFKAGMIDAWRALRRGEVLRWLTLLQFSDLMMDVLLGFLALYFVDVAGVTPAGQAWRWSWCYSPLSC